MELKHHWTGTGLLGPNVLGMNTRASDAGKIQVETLRLLRRELGGDKFRLWIQGLHFQQSFGPVIIEISWFRISTGVKTEFWQWEI